MVEDMGLGIWRREEGGGFFSKATGGREEVRFGAYPVNKCSGAWQILGAGGTNKPVAAIVFHGTAGDNEGAAVDLVANQSPTCQRQTIPMNRHANDRVRIFEHGAANSARVMIGAAVE